MSVSSGAPAFRQPTAVERLFNRFFGFLVGLGIGFKHNYLLEVRGRTSGKLYFTPIDLLEMNGKRFLVAPRGNTQWVRNAKDAGLSRTLQSGSAAILPIAAGSDVEAFADIAADYPVFELQPR